MHIRVTLSTASVYPGTCATAFELASRLGYDGIEVMVWTDVVSQEAGALRALSRHYGIPVLSVPAPTWLITQRVWGPEPWTKIDRSIELAADLDAPTVVLHPPFRWQKEYAAEFVDVVAARTLTHDLVDDGATSQQGSGGPLQISQGQAFCGQGQKR